MSRQCAAERAGALRDAAGWLERERIAFDCGVTAAGSALDSALERRISLAVDRAARHERARVLALAARLRTALGRPFSLGVERELEALLAAHADAPRGDVAWLEQSLAVVARSLVCARRDRHAQVVSIVVFGPTGENRRRASDHSMTS